MNDLLDMLKELRPECDFTESKNFIDEGLLDSLDIVMLVTKLEEKFGIKIEGEDVTPDNFINLEILGIFIERYLNKNDS